MDKLLWRVLPLSTLLISFALFFYLHNSNNAELYSIIKVSDYLFQLFGIKLLCFSIRDVVFLVTQLAEGECSLFPYDHYWISSKRILTSQGIISGSGLFSLPVKSMYV